MIILLIFFYVLALQLSIRAPHYFIVFYILSTTKFLGFLDPATFVIGGVELGYFGLNSIAIFGAFFKKHWYIMSKKHLGFLGFILLLLTYGIIKPFLDNNSSIFQSFIASKDTWFYFVLLYIVVYKDELDNLKLFKFLKFIGIYLSSVYIVGQISTKMVPPIYFHDYYIRTFFPTYISLAIFLYAVNLKFSLRRSLTDRLIVIYLFLGLFLASHLSLTVMTTIGFIAYKYVYSSYLTLNPITLSRFVLMILFLTGFAFATVTGLYQKVASDVSGIISGENNSLSSRDVYNQFRWEAIEKKKTMGYGFIHQSSRFMKEVKLRGNNRFMERFTVIDSGYVDMLIKFGYLGTILTVIVLSLYYTKGFLFRYKNPLSLSMSVFLMQYLFINYTWSVFTFAHGIVPGILAYHFLETSFLGDSEEKLETPLTEPNFIKAIECH